MVKSLLYDKRLPKDFWAKDVYIVVYLFNRSPTKSMRNHTPIEAKNGRKLLVKHLKVFESICLPKY